MCLLWGAKATSFYFVEKNSGLVIDQIRFSELALRRGRIRYSRRQARLGHHDQLVSWRVTRLRPRDQFRARARGRVEGARLREDERFRAGGAARVQCTSTYGMEPGYYINK